MAELRLMLESKTADFFRVLVERYKAEMEKRRQLHNQLVEINGIRLCCLFVCLFSKNNNLNANKLRLHLTKYIAFRLLHFSSFSKCESWGW